ncbi:MAG TPA: APC family permease, partial [Dehalococcoidia bacterium]
MDSEPSRPPDGTDPLEGHGRLSHDLELREVVRGRKPGSPYVRIMRARVFRRRGPGLLEATPRAGAPRGRLARLWAALRRLVIGPPLATSAIVHERLTKVKALAVFSSDALSSSAYATEEILLVLVLAGTGALSLSLPIAAVIAGLLVIVAVSYSQTIRAYPTGGGSYLVAKENLGLLPGLVAGSALMVDYVLTVAVSIAAGTAAIIAAFPELAGERVPLAVGAVVLIALINFRGIRESGTIFAIPTYFFIVAILGTIAVGAARQVLDLGPAHLPEGEVTFTPGGVPQELTLFLVLRAFASGCAALTGIEAIADGVPAFKPPEPRNAVITLGWMAAILATLFLGITVLARVYD